MLYYVTVLVEVENTGALFHLVYDHADRRTLEKHDGKTARLNGTSGTNHWNCNQMDSRSSYNGFSLL